jgi:hypothetical protein
MIVKYLLWSAVLLVTGCSTTLNVSPTQVVGQGTSEGLKSGTLIEAAAGQVFFTTGILTKLSLPNTMRANASVVLRYSFELTVELRAGEVLPVVGETDLDGKTALLVTVPRGAHNWRLLVRPDGTILPKLVFSTKVAPYSLSITPAGTRLEPGESLRMAGREKLIFLGAEPSSYRFMIRREDPDGRIIQELPVVTPRTEGSLRLSNQRFAVIKDSGSVLILRVEP